MAYQISDECVNCGVCEDACPNSAISEKDDRRWIDAEKCVDCGSCESECPSEAISQVA
jgi:NAD-dependent dihydropyrimidine dehydrogenase PreA subunit